MEADGRWWQTHVPSAAIEGVTILGSKGEVHIDPTARVEPLVLIDTRKGPVIIDREAQIQAFSRLEGPCYIGPATQVFAGRIKGSSIGPQCRIGGEVEASIVHGHSNKAHDGFLGHSYIGEWVNLGAGTQTSDLRNDYAKVTMVVEGQKVDTGLLKVGSFIGDHTKTSINTLFNTGSMCGPFAMLVATGTLLPRSLPAFCQVSQHRMTERTDLGQTFRTAKAMMARRQVSWTEDHAEFYLDLYERTTEERRKALGDSEQKRLRRVI